MAPPIDFAGLFRTSPNPYVLMDRDLFIREMNEAYLHATGRSREDILDRSMFEAFPSDPTSTSHRQLRNSLDRAIAHGKIDHLPLIRYDIAMPDGSMTERYWSATHTPLFDDQGALAYVLQHTVDITELHQLRMMAETVGSDSGTADALRTDIVRRAEAVQATNAALGQELRSLQTLFDQAPGFMAMLSGPDHEFTLANQAYYRIVGNRDLIGKSVAKAMPEVVDQGFVTMLDGVRRTGQPYIGKRIPIALHADGSSSDFVLDFIYQPIFAEDGSITGVFVQGHDVTDQMLAEAELRALNETLEARVSEAVVERRHAEMALQQAQRMEALGQLTGGVAHDFNNLLQVIASNLYLLQRDLTDDQRALPRVTGALAAVDRGAKLARQLLAFARKQPLDPEVVDLDVLFGSVGEMLNQALGEAIEIVWEIEDGLWNTLVDPSQIENVLLNLAINARDAMDGAGRLTVALGNVPAGSGGTDPAGGDWVRLSVSDTGHGMSADVLDKAFEPFFTTKPDGKGTGLGLSMVYGFVRQSGGQVSIESTPDVGTTVTLLLPRTRAEATLSLRQLAEGEIGHGEGVVLVAEDDEGVRETAIEMLGQHGFRTLSARDGAEALAILRSGEPVDLLFSDVIMPGPVRSPDLVRMARELRPSLKILFTSGYTQDIVIGRGRLGEGIELLPKPYTREQLLRKIAETLKFAPVQPAEVATGPLRVAVVEDDPLIRMSVVDMAEGLGHQVLEFESAEDALAGLSGKTIDVLVTDLGLPGMSGNDLAVAVRERLPRVGIVLATGAMSGSADAGAPRTVVLAKPFDEWGLSDAIGSVAAR